jgi:hypothetical protein
MSNSRVLAVLWREFRDSGIDDHNILRTVGVTADE